MRHGASPGSDDESPAIKAEAAKAGLKDVDLPTCDVAGETIDTGSEARCIAQYMNVHALEATGGFTYAQMGIYAAKTGALKTEPLPGGGTNNVEFAATDPKTGNPVQNGAGRSG